jgi:hypothetical protein
MEPFAVRADVRNCRRGMLRSSLGVLLFLGCATPPAAFAQQNSDLKQILDRLERIEAENRRLADEVRLLREQLRVTPPQTTSAPTTAATAPAEPVTLAETSAGVVAGSPESQAPIDEAVSVNSARIEEMSQTKVESSQKFPLRITGMALFNAFYNTRFAGGVENPTTASLTPLGAAGATMRQTIVGLRFNGPRTFLGGTINGTLYMDLFGGTTASLNHLLRLRVATIEMNWKNRSFVVGQDKPIVSPREPNSLAQVGVSPLTNAGNLWLWQPLAKYEERLHFGENAGLVAQVGVFQTNEGANSVQAEYVSTVERGRPALEGRFELWGRFGGGRRIEIAPAFHRSTSHAAGSSIPSELISVDWLLAPFSKLEFSGMYYSGQNIANLGALRQGFTIFSRDQVIPVHSKGGWAQLHFAATERLSFNVYGGQHNDRARDLLPATGISKNQAYFANAMYRLAPNFIVSLEGGNVRTSYVTGGPRSVNHYDLAFAYLF